MKICKYCNSISANGTTKCNTCGAIELENKCDNCGEIFDDAFCPNCGTKAGQPARTCPQCHTTYFSPACPNCGYMRSARVNSAQQPQQPQPSNLNVQPQTAPVKKSKLKTFGIVLLWIYFLPIMAIVTIWTKAKIAKNWKIALTVIISLLALIFWVIPGEGAGGNGPTAPAGVPSSTASQARAEPSTYAMVDSFIDQYNQTADTAITDAFEIDINDTQGDYYRDDFYLSSFDGALAKRGAIGTTSIDLIHYNAANAYIKPSFRIYASADTHEAVKDIIENSAVILDPDVKASDLRELYSDMEEGYVFFFQLGNIYVTYENTETAHLLNLDLSRAVFQDN